VTLFGSFARGEARADSDIDVLIVRRTGIADDDPSWADLVGKFKDVVRALTGNLVNLVEADENEISRLLRSRRPLWRAVSKAGAVLASEPNHPEGGPTDA